MVSCFAPFTAEEAWQRLGRDASVCDAGWPQADRSLITYDTTTCIVQVDGKLRDRLEVATMADEDTLRELALASGKVRKALADRTGVKVIVRPPKLVNVVSTSAAVSTGA